MVGSRGYKGMESYDIAAVGHRKKICSRSNMAKSGKQMTNQAVGIILALVIGGILIGYVLPIGIDAIFAADTSSWGTAETQLFELLPLFFVLVPLVVVVGWAMDAF